MTRQEMKAKRDSLSEKDIIAYSDLISQRIYDEVFSVGAIDDDRIKNVLGYRNIGSEPCLDALYERLMEEGYKLFLPVTFEEEIKFYQVDSLNDFTYGKYDIREPINREREYQADYAYVITPGLIFDEDRNRIGYGGGYYDKFFAKNPFVMKISPAYDFQVLSSLETNEWDIPLDLIVTESRVIY